MTTLSFTVHLGMLNAGDVTKYLRLFAAQRGLTFDHVKGPGWLSADHHFSFTGAVGRDLTPERESIMRWFKAISQ